MPSPAEREKALDTALAQIDRQFGKGSVMRLGSDDRAPVEVIPTGSIALDSALGIDKGGDSAVTLRIGNCVQGDGGFTRRFWAVDFYDSATRQPADTKR